MSDTQKPVIDSDACTGCTICIEECPADCLEMKDYTSTLSNPDECTGCSTCEEICPVSAITME